MADSVAMSFACPNYSGMLFNKGNTKTPFSTLIGNRWKYTDHVEFVTGQEFETASGSQPAISEEASLTAPDASFITREQKTNVTQIFQETVKVSYGKMANMGTLSGVNISGQQANPIDELDFQIAAKMAKIAQDIEFVNMQGVYNKAASDSQVNKTRGMFPAITSNVIDAEGQPLGLWLVAEAIKAVADANGDPASLVLWLDATSRFQLNADAQINGMTIVESGRTINGINIETLRTPAGDIGLYSGKYIPAGSVGLFNPDVIFPVAQPVPAKGNFFLEELAKTGAGSKYQIYGEYGLDHGPEWYHAKITGLSTAFEAPKSGIHVYMDSPVSTIETDAVLVSATAAIGDSSIDASYKLNVTPGTAPTIAYQWHELASATTKPAAGNAMSGKTSAALALTDCTDGKFYACVVTASGTATGSATTNVVEYDAG